MKNERCELMYVVPPGLSTREPLHHGFTPMTTTCRHFLATSSLAPPKASIPSKVDTLTNNYCYIFIFRFWLLAFLNRARPWFRFESTPDCRLCEPPAVERQT